MAQEANKIRIKLKAWDHRIIDEAASRIVEAAVTTGARVKGPTPLPTERKLFVVTISPHGDKDAQEHYEILTHKRLIDIQQAGVRTMDSLQHLDLPAGVEISIKM